MMLAQKQQTASQGQEATQKADSAWLRISGRVLLVALLLLLAALAVKVVFSAQTTATMFTYPFQFD